MIVQCPLAVSWFHAVHKFVCVTQAQSAETERQSAQILLFNLTNVKPNDSSTGLLAQNYV